jgi:hypothetical protein
VNNCANTPVQFTATGVNTGSAPSYQWQVNGANVGTNSSVFTSVLSNSDQVKVIVTSSLACATTPTASSNIITLALQPNLTPSLTIAGNTTVLQGQSSTIVASPVNQGTAPLYQWADSIDNTGWKAIPGATNPTIVYTPTVNGAKLVCGLKTSIPCYTDSLAASNRLTFNITTPTGLTVPDLFNISYGPNPVRRMLVISNLKSEQQWQTAETYSLEGRKIISTAIQLRSRVEIDLKELPRGAYVLVLNSRKGYRVCLPLVKQ